MDECEHGVWLGSWCDACSAALVAEGQAYEAVLDLFYGRTHPGL